MAFHRVEFNTRISRLSLSLFCFSRNNHLIHPRKYLQFRGRMEKFLEGQSFQIFMLLLLGLDIVILLLELIIEADYSENEQAEEAEHALFWISVSILCIFGVEQLLLIFALGWKYFR
jgi:hypothetical protein